LLRTLISYACSTSGYVISHNVVPSIWYPATSIHVLRQFPKADTTADVMHV